MRTIIGREPAGINEFTCAGTLPLEWTRLTCRSTRGIGKEVGGLESGLLQTCDDSSLILKPSHPPRNPPFVFIRIITYLSFRPSAVVINRRAIQSATQAELAHKFYVLACNDHDLEAWEWVTSHDSSTVLNSRRRESTSLILKPSHPPRDPPLVFIGIITFRWNHWLLCLNPPFMNSYTYKL